MAKVKTQTVYSGEISELIVSTAQAAALLGLSPQWIRQMPKDGWVQQVSRGKWNLSELLRGRENQRKDTEGQASKSASASRATDARTREIEFRIARQEGKFVPVPEVDEFFDELTGEFLTMLSGLPTRITRNKRERDRIEAIVDQERARIADRFAKKAESLLPHG